MTVCDVCGASAVWMHGPGPLDSGRAYFCDEHVSREGCSCNLDDSGVLKTDEHGRDLPCVDFVWIGPDAS